MKTTYSRRNFLKTCSLATAALYSGAARSAIINVAAPAVEYVLRGGQTYIDGHWCSYDIGITPKGRLIVDRLPIPCDRIINVTGKVVSPGFIDILADNSSNPEKTFLTFEKYKLGDGVTTALQMHGGATHAGDYYRHFGQEKHYVNYGVSTKVMNLQYKYPALAPRLKAIESSLEEGALGVSHSPEYHPDTTWEELLSYARLARKYERPLFLHTRYSSREKELQGVDEAIRLAQQTGCRVHIDHLNSTGGTFHMAEALQRIRSARSNGQEITTCVYPCSYWATYLHSARFKGDWQSRYNMTYSDLEVVGTGERLTEESFNRYREQAGILVAARCGVQPMDTTVRLALREDFCVIGSDGGIEKERCANNHPRGANCFSTAIRYALDEHIPLEKILDKMTTRSTRIIGFPMRGRGELREGYIADLTVFDPGTIRGMATNADPCRFSAGIELVIVNGKIALDKSKPTGVMNGTDIKYQSNKELER
ncbi:amidohydrolase family protein [Parabacteroides sp.]